MTLQLSQRALMEALTFNGSSRASRPSSGAAFSLLESVCDPAARQVVGRKLYSHAVAGQDPDEVHPKLSGDMRQHSVPVLELDRKHRVRQRLEDRAFHFDRISFRHSVLGPFLTRNAGPDGPTHERVAYQKRAPAG